MMTQNLLNGPQAQERKTPASRIIIAGASGFIGTALHTRLHEQGYDVTVLHRGGGEASWDPAKGELDESILSGSAAVVCLSGASIAGRAWTQAYRRTLISSRVNAVGTIVAAIGRLKEHERPGAFVCSSAVGYYGAKCADTVLAESAPAGKDFLAHLCAQWESTAAQADLLYGVRTANMRTGLVIAAHGGILKRVLWATRWGLGARLGDGRQWMPVISLEDAVRAFIHVIDHQDISGPINVCAPQPVRQALFQQQLAAAVRRPAFLNVPQGLMHSVGGDFAEQTLLASQRAVPQVLLDSGFRFLMPDSASIVEHYVGAH